MHSLFFHILDCCINEKSLDKRSFVCLTPHDWESLHDISKLQGTTAIIFSKLQELPRELQMPKKSLLKWYSHTLNVEKHLRKMYDTSVDFAQKLADKGIPLVVLKGVAFGLNYPNPLHRECGDLDCYMLGLGKAGDILTVEIGGTCEDGGYKHSHLNYCGLSIENHYYLTDFNNTQRGIKTERFLQRLIQDDFLTIGDTLLLNPNVNFNACFLLQHAQNHFILEGIRVRHLLDWAYFLKKQEDFVDWEMLLLKLEELRMLKFAQLLTSVCVKFFGLEVKNEILKSGDFTETYLNFFMTDVLGEQPSIYNENIFQKIPRILRRFRRLWKFRELASEGYFTYVWNTFAFSSYWHRKVSLN